MSLPLFPDVPLPPTQTFDAEAEILTLQQGDTVACPFCGRATEQRWECGEPDFYEMTCLPCGKGYGVRVAHSSEAEEHP